MNNFIPRPSFLIHKKIQWFPGHMRKGIRDIGKRLKVVDCVLEIHDARIPFSGRNLNFISKIATVKPVILLLNKADLIDRRWRNDISSRIQDQMAQNGVQMSDIVFMDSLTAKANQGGYNSKV